MHALLHLNRPRKYTEIIQYQRLYEHDPLVPTCVDKIAVRDFVADRLHDDSIGYVNQIPLLGVYDRFDDIDFGMLPDRFVLKCNHDSDSVVVCSNSASFNFHEARVKLERCLSRNFYYVNREWQYKNIQPKIIAEQYLEDDSGYELKDYKVFVFDGTAKYIEVDFDRFTNHKRNIYDTEWNQVPLQLGYPCGITVAKPKELHLLLSAAESLAKGFPHVRVDFYISNGKIYFGEMTFSPDAGYKKFVPEYYNDLWGTFIPINNTVFAK
jgi:hypothetical protein